MKTSRQEVIDLGEFGAVWNIDTPLGGLVVPPAETGVGGGHPLGSGNIPMPYHPNVGSGLMVLEEIITHTVQRTYANHDVKRARLEAEVIDDLKPFEFGPVNPTSALAVKVKRGSELVAEYQAQIAHHTQRAQELFGPDVWGLQPKAMLERFLQWSATFGVRPKHQIGQFEQALSHAEMAERTKHKLPVLRRVHQEAVREFEQVIGPSGQTPPAWEAQLAAARGRADAIVAELPNFVLQSVRQQLKLNSAGAVDYVAGLLSATDTVRNAIPPETLDKATSDLIIPVRFDKAMLEQQHVEVERYRGQVVYPFMLATKNREVARHLNEASLKLAALLAVTEASHGQLAAHQVQAQAMAAEQARQAEAAAREQAALREAQLNAQRQAEAEAERQAKARDERLDKIARQAALVSATLAEPGALAVTLPMAAKAPALVIGGNTVAGLQTPALQLLRQAIAQATGQLITAGVRLAGVGLALLPGLVVGTLALLWPATLARSERPAALLFPLADVDPSLDVSAALDGQVVHLKQAVAPVAVDSGIDIRVVTAPVPFLQARVVDLQHSADTGLYQSIVDQPPRVITVSPAIDPIDASTHLPAEQPEPAVMPGPQLDVHTFGENVTPGYEHIDVEIYILRYPEAKGIAPVYLAVKRPPVVLGEVGAYDDLAARSKKDGIDIDHIPSRAALTIFYQQAFEDLTDAEIDLLIKQSPAIAIPNETHRAHSETYGGRNTKERARTDAIDPRAAVESNMGALKQDLLARGLSEEGFAESLAALHTMHIEKGNYQ